MLWVWNEEDATMRFDGIGAGPFHGRAGIADAFRSSPPDDTLIVGPTTSDGGDVAEADYAWSRRPAPRSGRLRVESKSGQITLLVVTRY